VAVQGRRGRTIRLVVSAGDAARLREWAVPNGVLMEDPRDWPLVRHGRGPDRDRTRPRSGRWARSKGIRTEDGGGVLSGAVRDQ